jgi:lysophospholipase L1-like esterase
MRSIGSLCWIACLLPSALPAQTGFYLKDGDKVVFYGDSITDSRLYTVLTEAYVLTRFPDLHVRFITSGVGGDRVSGGALGSIELRLQRDVIAYRPSVVTILLGMNDGDYRPFDPRLFQAYSTGYENIIATLRKAVPQVRITALAPSPYDDVTRPPLFEGGYNSVQVHYGQWLRGLAKRGSLEVADLNPDFVAVLRALNDKDPALAQKVIPDRVHPALAGHLLMAEALLKSWNAPPIVTAVDIDTSDGAIRREENTRISGFQRGRTLTWTQLDQSLPMPIDWKDIEVNRVVHASDLMSSLNDEALRIRNLEPGDYVLSIDGDPIGTFTDRQLGNAINLAELETPMSKQAADVMILAYYRDNIHFASWRVVQVSLEKYRFKDKFPAMQTLDALEEEVVAAQRTAAQPKPHRYELVRVEKCKHESFSGKPRL